MLYTLALVADVKPFMAEATMRSAPFVFGKMMARTTMMRIEFGAAQITHGACPRLVRTIG
jgi:hypothetical protein